jgi:hypothetical protein
MGKNMAEYEFTEEENRHIDSLRRRLQHIAILFLILGVMQLAQSFLLADETGRWISLAASFLILGLGWLFMRPLDNLGRIITTEGQDIREVVIAIKDLRVAYLGAEIIMLIFAAGIIIEVMRLTSN